MPTSFNRSTIERRQSRSSGCSASILVSFSSTSTSEIGVGAGSAGVLSTGASSETSEAASAGACERSGGSIEGAPPSTGCASGAGVGAASSGDFLSSSSPKIRPIKSENIPITLIVTHLFQRWKQQFRHSPEKSETLSKLHDPPSRLHSSTG